MCTIKNTKRPNPKQVFKSDVGGSTLGIAPSQLEIKINKNNVMTSGKNFFQSSPSASLQIWIKYPTSVSVAICILLGISFILVFIKIEKTIRDIIIPQVKINVVGFMVRVKSNPGMLKEIVSIWPISFIVYSMPKRSKTATTKEYIAVDSVMAIAISMVFII